MRDRRARRQLLGARPQPPAQASLMAKGRPGRPHRIAGLRSRRRLAQAREAQPEDPVHARAVAAVQGIQLRLQVGQPHLRAQHGISVAPAVAATRACCPCCVQETQAQRAVHTRLHLLLYVLYRVRLVP